MENSVTDLLLRIAPHAEDIGRGKAAGDDDASALGDALMSLADAVEIGSQKEMSVYVELCNSLFLKWLSHKVCMSVCDGMEDASDPNDAQEGGDGGDGGYDE